MVIKGTTVSDIPAIRRTWDPERTRQYIASLPIWGGAEVEVKQHFGGLQNRTYFVTTPEGEKYAVRTGFDQFRVRQPSVVNCTIAAHTLGLGPRLVYAEPNLTVVEWVNGQGIGFEAMKEWQNQREVIDAMKVLHEGAWAIQETISYWWPFDSVRRYLKWMETGRPETGFKPSALVHRVPEFRDITNRLEKVIAPYIPKFTHNDMVAVNIMVGPQGEIILIDWDGGAYGHPMFDLGEMLMWGEADDDRVEQAVRYYYGDISNQDLKQRMREVHAFQVVSGIRLITETCDALLDPYFHLTPDEVARSMQIILPGQNAGFEGLIDVVTPIFEANWAKYKHEFDG